MLFIFDMGGVVTSTFRMDLIYKELGIDKETFFKICNHKCKAAKKDLWDALEKENIDAATFWKLFNKRGKKYNIIPARYNLFRLFFHPVLNEKTVALIKELRKKHRVVCGTNTNQSHWENHLERGDYTYFDQTYASNKIGLAKPDPDFFKLILEAEGYKAQDAFFVDDKEENCRAAASLGIQTKRMESPEDLYKEWIKYSE